MTHEEQGPRPDNPLVPPTSTRWSEEASAGGEDGLLAPFIPGQSRRGAGERPAAEQAAHASAEPPVEQADEWPEASGGTTEPEPADVAEEPFPFDMPWGDEEADGSVDGPLAEDVAPEGDDGDDLPLEGYGAESGYDDEGYGAATYDEPDDREPAPGESAYDEVGYAEPGYEESGYEESGYEDRGPAASGLAAGTGAGTGGAGGAAEELAARLEMLASRLRSEGADGVERELASSDRLTSLLAAVLAGHLASR